MRYPTTGWVSTATADWGRSRVTGGNTRGGSHAVIHADPTCPRLCEDNAPITVLDGTFWPRRSHRPISLPWCRMCSAPTPRGSWAERAACKGAPASMFFPDRGRSVKPAKQVCGRCPVSGECLAYALASHAIVGIWGGTSEDERARLRSCAVTGGTSARGSRSEQRAAAPSAANLTRGILSSAIASGRRCRVSRIGADEGAQ